MLIPVGGLVLRNGAAAGIGALEKVREAAALVLS
jgi:hypothetical protein